jgi:glycosyltransferase involved in cell wall biosynthesis
MKVAINQIRGNSGVDVWAQNLCEGLQKVGVSCNLNLLPGIYQFSPGLIPLRKTTCDDADVIQSHTWNGFGFRNKTPLVVTEHGVLHDPLLEPYKSLGQKLFHRQVFKFEKKSLAVADAVVCVSEDTRQKLVKVFGYTDARVIHNGIDTSIFRPREIADTMWDLPKNKTILLFTGNLTRMKGADLLPGIMDLLGDCYLLLVTSGFKHNVEVHQKNIVNIGLQDQNSLINAYNSCDIFLATTRLEGFGLTIAEVMSCGKPVVATNCSAIPELVVDGKGGFLCEMDNVKEFVTRIRYLGEDIGEREKMGMFNRERVQEKFELSLMVKQYINLYKSL